MARMLLAGVAVLAAGLPGPAADPPKLQVSQPALHQFEGGPPVAGSFEFFAGDTVFLSFHVAGYRLVEHGDDERIQLSYVIEAADPGGLALNEKTTGRIVTDVTPQDKKNKWMPLVRYDVGVPPTAPGGTYRIRIRVNDELAETAAEEEVSFAVRGYDIEPSRSLVIRDFEFFRSDTSTRPLTVPAFRPGDTVWARFHITGYRFGEGNRFHINYGLQVLRASGEVLHAREVAAEEQDESFYPRRHMQSSFGLPLTADLPKGDYTIVLTVRDLIGEQTFETSQVFHVE